MLLLVASAVIAAPVAAPASRPEAFQNTDQLVRDASFKRELGRFLAAASKHRSAHRRRLETLEPTMPELLGGPPDTRLRTSGGSYLFTACRAHSCPEKGGVVLGADGHMIAAAAIIYQAPDSDEIVVDDPQLHIWVDGASEAATDAVDALAQWGVMSFPSASPKGPFVTRFDTGSR